MVDRYRIDAYTDHGQSVFIVRDPANEPVVVYGEDGALKVEQREGLAAAVELVERNGDGDLKEALDTLEVEGFHSHHVTYADGRRYTIQENDR